MVSAPAAMQKHAVNPARQARAEVRTRSHQAQRRARDHSVSDHRNDDAGSERSHPQRGDGQRLTHGDGDDGQQSANAPQGEERAQRGGKTSLTVTMRVAREEVEMEVTMRLRFRRMRMGMGMGVRVKTDLAQHERPEHNDAGKQQQRAREHVEPRFPDLRQQSAAIVRGESCGRDHGRVSNGKAGREEHQPARASTHRAECGDGREMVGAKSVKHAGEEYEREQHDFFGTARL